jgi:general secretion pathway protein C
MKIDYRQWSAKLRSWFGGLLNKRPRGLPGLPALPGKRASLRAGSFKLPLINWENIYRKSFLYNSIVVVICAYFMADLAIQALRPYFPEAAPPRPRLAQGGDRNDMSRYAAVLTRNLFNIHKLVPNADESGGGFDGPPVRSSLPLTLLGVIVTSDDLKSVASVEDKGSNQVLAVRVNEPITRGTLVQKIESDRVIFTNESSGRREYIELPKDVITATRRAAPARPSAGGIVDAGNGRFSIDRKEVDRTLENMSQVLTEARCVPNIEGGRPAGFRCFQIVPGSIYDKLGLKDNDVICGINGEPVNDISKAVNFLTELRNGARQIQICVSRNGKQMNLVYDIN